MGYAEPLNRANDAAAVEIWQIASDVARANVFSIGGALHDLTFTFANGQQFAPLAEASWQRDYLTQKSSDHPRHIELLGGEWPCVPFGTTPVDPAHHGFGTDNHWHVISKDENAIKLATDYPSDHAVKRLERKITLPFGKQSAEIELSVTARKDVQLPIGAHPILRVPTGKWAVNPGQYSHVSAFSAYIGKPNPLQISADGIMETHSHKKLNLWENPDKLSSELIQIWGSIGRFELLDYGKEISTRIGWDPAAFPHCLLWFPQPDMTIDAEHPPFRGLGVEPINSVFDKMDNAETTQPQAGIFLKAGETWTTHYNISCATLNQINKKK